MRGFLIALQFLTILPLPSPRQYHPDDLGRATVWFPLAGLCIGGLLYLADLLLSPLFPRHLTDALLITLLALITGALHLDGLADVFDGFAARGNRERFLAVMKDSRVGAVGVVGLMLVLLLKYAALLALPIYLKRPALLLFPLLARLTQVLIMTGAKSARTDGLGAAFLSGMGSHQLSLALASTIPLAWLLGHWAGLVALGICLVWGWAIRRSFTRRLGGITGDIIGFASETAELLTLLTLTACTALLGRLL
ncbi:MAG: adenosylcobinamide-GDP ribazoletransferase [Geobacter sp.]|jgi:adenosylcobinamide-GDP ribazoletransferase|nr:adenosylcobinamide-GDP ribazoletransferase [Geobacter sp.]